MSERAMEVLHALPYCPEKCQDMEDATGALCGCAANIEAAIQRAIAAESEARATIAEDSQDRCFFSENEGPPVARYIAKQIRARTAK